MALSILDGNQSATTLSTILSSGQHITAHTVVSLGTQAITDMRGAVSGSVVSVSSLPTISGTVTANAQFPIGGESFVVENGGIAGERGVQIAVLESNNTEPFIVGDAHPLPISGTVTANLVQNQIVNALDAFGGAYSNAFPVVIDQTGFGNVPISGTVTIGAGTAQIGSVTASISGTVPISISSVTVGNSVTIGSLPAISGTVTANTFALQGTAVTTSNFTSTTASTVLANYNATREVLTIFNEGAGNLHICAGATCTTIAYQVRLSAGDYYEVPNHQTTITHSAVFATAGTARVCQVS